MRLLFLFSFLFYSATVYAQMYQFQKTYGDAPEDAHAIGVTPLPGDEFLISGVQSTGNGTMNSAFVMKIAGNGDTIWTRTYRGAATNHYANGAAIAGSGFVVFGGTNEGSGQMDLFTLTINANGDTVRTFTYGGTGDDYCISGNGAGVELEGNYVFCGQSTSYGAGLFDCYLVKTDFTGSVVWSRTYGGIYSEQGGVMVHTSDSGFACTGLTTSFGSGGADVYLLKTDSLGNLLWAKSYGLSGDEHGYGIIETSDNGFLISGMRIIAPNDYDAFLIKTDSIGNLLWVKQYGNTGANDWGSSAIEVSSGGYVLCGRTGSFGNGSEDILLIRTDAQGDTLWTRAFGGPYNDYAYSVTETGGGGFIIAGGGPGPSGVRDKVYIVRTDANGYSGCYETSAPINVSSPNFQQANAPMTQSNGCISTIPTWQCSAGTNQQSFCFGVGTDEWTIQNKTALLFPCPAHDELTVKVTSAILSPGENFCMITDATGRTINLIPMNDSELKIDISGYLPGVYFCCVQNENGVTPAGKFLVE